MDVVFKIILAAHIAIGICALTLFWFPAFSKKGSPRHKKFGNWYSISMYGVVISGILMASLSILIPELVKPAAFTADVDNSKVRESIIRFAVLLLHLSILTLVAVRYGKLVLTAKVDRQRLKSPFQLLITGALLMSGIVIFWRGMIDQHILMLIFGPLGIFISLTNLHFTFKRQIKPRDWLVEHLGGYIGSGIAAFTAFLSFGGRHIFASSGYLQLAFWIAPGVIGVLFIFFLSRKYAN
ncbi:MAG: hypothetical protein ACTH4U_04440 [Pseudoalteromonas prydzensis]|uniref:hypothetical protein n=1 Tax=Pseudoalteromonas prydzensis TaxID=182141 RepID=UPI003F9E77AA